MDKDTNSLLRAIIRRAIATQNYLTTLILDQVMVMVMPKRDENGKVMPRALVLSESDYKTLYGADKTDFNLVRYDQTYRTINSFFYATSNPILKQAFKYMSINGNRVNAVLDDLMASKLYDCKKSLKLFDEFYDLFESFAYNAQKGRVDFNFDLEKLNNTINKGIKSRTGVSNNYDFKPLLKIMQRDLEKWESRTVLNYSTTENNNNTILNYLDTYALLEYYLYRKKINEYFLQNVNRPLYKNVPKKCLMQEAVDSQIFPRVSEGQPDPVFKNPSMENVNSKKLTHDHAKLFTNDLISNPSVVTNIPELLNAMLAEQSSIYNSNTYIPNFSVSALQIKPVVDPKTGKTKYRFDIETSDVPLSQAPKGEVKDNTRRYAQHHQALIDTKSSTPISLFDNIPTRTKSTL